MNRPTIVFVMVILDGCLKEESPSQRRRMQRERKLKKNPADLAATKTVFGLSAFPTGRTTSARE